MIRVRRRPKPVELEGAFSKAFERPLVANLSRIPEELDLALGPLLVRDNQGCDPSVPMWNLFQRGNSSNVEFVPTWKFVQCGICFTVEFVKMFITSFRRGDDNGTDPR